MNTTREITCIGCPIGCSLTVTVADGVVTKVSGNECGHGPTYARQECTRPERMVTALMSVPGLAQPLSVKTARPIPKDKIHECLEAIRQVRPSLPQRIGQVVLEDVAGTGVPLLATCDLSAPAQVLITPLPRIINAANTGDKGSTTPRSENKGARR